VRCAPGACTWLLMVLASLGACSDTFVVGRECSSCQTRLHCQDGESCPPLCALAEPVWETYETCVCQECTIPCDGCPAHELSVTTFDCRSCPALVSAEDGPCHDEWLACSDS
jgi:hypothetical protein